MTRIYSNELKEGVLYSAPLFFDDGANMFLAKRRKVKKYHIDILKKWAIPFVLTYGTVVDDETIELRDDIAELEELDVFEEELVELQAPKSKTFDKAQFERIVKNFSENREYVIQTIEKLRLSLNKIYKLIKFEKNFSREEIEPITENIIELVKNYPSESLNILLSTCYDSSYEIKAIVSSIIGMLIAEKMSIRKNEIKNLVIASLLHDIGMFGVPQEIREKQTKLTRQEFELLKLHLIKSAHLTNERLYYPKEIGDIILQHHERYDGSGYPKGLEGDEILISAQILSLTDSFSAMVCRNTYGKPLSGYEAIKELSKRSEEKFSPEIFKSFISVLGYYPVGTYVLLSSQHIAQVIEANKDFPYQPKVHILTKSINEKAEINIGDKINLQEHPHLSIIQQIKNE